MSDLQSDLSPEVAPPGRRVEAKVKWFNASKGFGFVTMADGSPDAFLPMAILRRAGYEDVREGASITCEVGAGAKGPLVTTVLNIDLSTAVEPGFGGDRRGARPKARSNGSSPTRATASSRPMAAARTCSSTSPRCAAAASTCWGPANGCGSRSSTAVRVSKPTISHCSRRRGAVRPSTTADAATQASELLVSPGCPLGVIGVFDRRHKRSIMRQMAGNLPLRRQR
jgi:cold shock CspA family protein